MRKPVPYYVGVGALVLFAGIGLSIHWPTSVERPSGDDARVPGRLAARGQAIPRIIHCRDKPLRVRPLPGLENTVTEEQLVNVLCASLPYWSPPCVPGAIHELKLWGRRFHFTTSMLGTERDGDALVRALLSDSECRAKTVTGDGSYLLDSPYGIRVVLHGTDDAEGYRAESHYAQLLRMLAEVDVPSDTAVATASGRTGTIKDIYQDAVLRYGTEAELDYIACALAYWHPPQRTWQDQFGDTHGFDELLVKLLSRGLGKGTCGGTHLPYAVVAILRVNEQVPIISEEKRSAAIRWLTRLGHMLEERWSSSGGWDKTWTGDNSLRDRLMWGDNLLDRICITGHHLEWMALAPLECRPSETVIRRAVQSLCADVKSLPAMQYRSFKTLMPVSHAARALALFRGVDPFQLWLRYWNAGRLRRTATGFVVRATGPNL